MKHAVSLPVSKYPGLNEAGCDEAGRGPLAGPVFAAAVILPPDFSNPLLNDSKQMSRRDRESLREIIEREAVAWAVASVSAGEIDTMNILNASITAMHRAVLKLSVKPGFLLVDGNRFRSIGAFPWEKDPKDRLDIPWETVVGGDASYADIAAASVLAKTYRDAHMAELAARYPGYGWEHNAGYPTAEHIRAIRELGYTSEHRRSFHPKELEPTLFDEI